MFRGLFSMHAWCIDDSDRSVAGPSLAKPSLFFSVLQIFLESVFFLIKYKIANGVKMSFFISVGDTGRFFFYHDVQFIMYILK